MDKAPLIGIVTVTYNSGSVLAPFLSSLLGQDNKDYLLYVVDNSSKDNTIEQLLACPDPRIRLITSQENLGVAEGNNIGIRAALADHCEYVLLLNNDVEFEPSLLDDLLAGIAEESCDMVVPKMYYFDEPTKIWCAGGGFISWRGYAPEHFGEGEDDLGQHDQQKRIIYCPTCCMLIKSNLFPKIGMMDPKYFVYWDDADFCFRAFKNNCTLYYIPKAKLWHKVSSLTGGVGSLFAVFYYTRNKVYFLLKNQNKVKAIFFLLLYWLYLVISSIVLRIGMIAFRERNKAFWRGLSLYMQP